MAIRGGPRSSLSSVRRVIISAAVLAALASGGCATQAVGPTPPAFAEAASHAQGAFEAARTAEADAFRSLAFEVASRSGRVASQHCLEPGEASRCSVLVTVDGAAVDTGAVGTELSRKADALVAYGAALRSLASAQDLVDEETAIGKMGKAAGAVFAAAGVPGVEAVTGVAADILEKARLARRREDLLRLARQVDPAMAPLAAALTRTTLALRANIVLARSQTVADTQTRLLGAAPGSPERLALIQALFEAAQRERSAAALDCDYSALPRAHTAMLLALSDPRIDPKAAILQIDQLADELAATRAAFATSTKS